MSTLIARLRRKASRQASILIGFDFPLGLPATYADRARIAYFPDFLQELVSDPVASGNSRWSRFHEVCSSEEEISLERPFYPIRPGGARRDAIHPALGLAHRNQLYRQCELRHAERTNACSLFWTLGGNQVGKSALLGWRKVLGPELALYGEAFRLWPFHGSLEEWILPGVVVAVESYPTEYHARLFGRALRGKRFAARRLEVAPAWLETAHRLGIRIDRTLRRQILSGFATKAAAKDRADGRDEQDDAMDAAIGLFGMLDALVEYGPHLEPRDAVIRNVEGWIFGLAHPLSPRD
jgi:hypothetical protein